MSAEAELGWKQSRLLKVLAEKGQVKPERLLQPLVGDRWRYRRKARLSVRDVPAKERVLVGFRERDGRFVTDMKSCQTLYGLAADRLAELSDLLGQMEARATIPQIEVSCGDDSCALVFRHLESLSEQDRSLLGDFEASSGMQVYLQPGGPATIHPLVPADSRLRYSLPEHDLEYRFEPLDFVQVNGSINQLMITQALELLAPTKDERVLDLFCGLGNFTLPLAQQAASVLGIEGSEDLVQRARDNAERNQLTNVSFRAADLYSDEFKTPWVDGAFDAVLLDPPRSGAGAVLHRLVETGAGRVVYVSCNPDSLATDASTLVNELGYRLAASGVVDMFPQTNHMESMSLFVRTDGA